MQAGVTEDRQKKIGEIHVHSIRHCATFAVVLQLNSVTSHSFNLLDNIPLTLTKYSRYMQLSIL